MRILLINPPSRDGTAYMKEIARCGRKSAAGEIWPQTGLAYLAAVVLEAGGLPAIIDAQAEGEGTNDTLERVRRFAPELVIACTTTPTFADDCRFMRELRQVSDAAQAMAGTHVTVLPERSLGESGVDFVFIGEPEETLAEFIRSDPADRVQVPGIVVWTAEGVRNNGARRLIGNLDQLPFPARDRLPNERYRLPVFPGKRFATVIPARGCPHGCSFCRAGIVWGRQIRLRSPASIVAELKTLADVRIRHFAFMTDTLTLKRDWLLELCELMHTETPELQWVANSRVDSVDAELLEVMRRAGCRLVSYGVESGCQGILDRCGKGITPEQSMQAIRLTRKAGMLSMAYFVLGLPGETPDTLAQTMRFALELDPDYANFHIATPFPGTDLHQEAEQQGWLRASGWQEYDQGGASVLERPGLSAKDLLTAQRQATRGFYRRPTFLLRELLRTRTPAQLWHKLSAGHHLLTNWSAETES